MEFQFHKNILTIFLTPYKGVSQGAEAILLFAPYRPSEGGVNWGLPVRG